MEINEEQNETLKAQARVALSSFMLGRHVFPLSKTAATLMGEELYRRGWMDCVKERLVSTDSTISDLGGGMFVLDMNMKDSLGIAHKGSVVFNRDAQSRSFLRSLFEMSLDSPAEIHVGGLNEEIEGLTLQDREDGRVGLEYSGELDHATLSNLIGKLVMLWQKHEKSANQGVAKTCAS